MLLHNSNYEEVLDMYDDKKGAQKRIEDVLLQCGERIRTKVPTEEVSNYLQHTPVGVRDTEQQTIWGDAAAYVQNMVKGSEYTILATLTTAGAIGGMIKGDPSLGAAYGLIGANILREWAYNTHTTNDLREGFTELYGNPE